MMAKWVCSECKQSNNSHARYCMKCGHFKEGGVYKKATVTWLCPICKEENNDHRKYCFKCGHWLLSEINTPSRIEEEQQKSYPKSPKLNKKISESKTSKTAVLEIIVLVILGCYIVNEEGSLLLAIPFITVWFFIIHFLFSIIYIAKSYLRNGIVESGKKLLKHGAFLLGIFIIGSIATGIESDNIAKPQAGSLIAVTNNAVELQYEDMLRNANGKYRNMYVKISGEVYHLENGKQKNIMINMSTDPQTYQAVYVKRNEQDKTLILNDKVVIYGKLSGTTGTINVLGVESAVPVIESYSLNLKNE